MNECPPLRLQSTTNHTGLNSACQPQYQHPNPCAKGAHQPPRHPPPPNSTPPPTKHPAAGDLKKRAARIVGNLCTLANDPRDMAPYVTLLLPELKVMVSGGVLVVWVWVRVLQGVGGDAGGCREVVSAGWWEVCSTLVDSCHSRCTSCAASQSQAPAAPLKRPPSPSQHTLCRPPLWTPCLK